MNRRPEVTELLEDVARGSELARKELFELVYFELKRMARSQLRRAKPSISINPTTLLHEAWIKLARGDSKDFEGSVHFYNIFSQAMRHVLIDFIRSRETAKHGRDLVRADLTDRIEQPEKSLDDILAVDAALQELRDFDPELAQLVEWHFFGGASFVEIAKLRGVTERTVRRHWDMARLFLENFIANKSSDAPAKDHNRE